MSVKDRAKMFSSNNLDKGIQEDLLKNKNSSTKNPSSGCCYKTKNVFKDIWADKTKRYIFIGVISFIIIFFIVIIIIVSSNNPTPSTPSKKTSPSEQTTPSDQTEEKTPSDKSDRATPSDQSDQITPSDQPDQTEVEFEKPNCEGVCTKPYNIQVYTEGILKKKLLECGYKEDSQLFNFALSAIRRHNVVRACHIAQPLMFNCEIMKIAQDYSEHLANDVKSLVHSSNTFHGEWMGENLASAYGYSINGELPTNMWYNEIKDYNFNKPGFSSNTGHFTQVVWKASKEFGIGLACSGYCYMTGNYYPGGNYNNMYSTQVQNLQ